MFAQPSTSPARRTPTVDGLERRYLALHGGDREAAARNLAVDLMTIEGSGTGSTQAAAEPATLRRYRRAAVMACGVLRLPMAHATIIYEDTVEYVREHLLPGSGGHGRPITPWEAAALTTRRAA